MPLHEGRCQYNGSFTTHSCVSQTTGASNKCGTCLVMTCDNSQPLFGTTVWQLHTCTTNPYTFNTQHTHATTQDYCKIVDGRPASLVVTIDNTCPECVDGSHIDIFQPAFGKLASGTVGYINVKWDFAPCPSAGSISVRAEAWEDGGYRRLRIR